MLEPFCLDFTKRAGKSALEGPSSSWIDTGQLSSYLKIFSVISSWKK